MTIEKITPNNLDAERAVIGSILLDKEAVAKCLELLTPAHFYLASHQLIFKSVSDLYLHNQPADIVTVSDQLKLQGFLEDIGGYKYLLDLVESVPTTANIERYAKIVEEKFIRRELLRLSTEISEMCYSSTMDVAGLIDSAEKGIFALSQKRFTRDLVPIGQMLVNNYQTVTMGYPEDGSPHRQISLQTGILTGLNQLDEWTNGLNPSDLIVIAARPAMGKTAFCLNIAVNIALKSKLPVAIFSLEMSKEQLAQRMLSAHSEINNYSLKTGNITQPQWDQLTKATAELYDAPIYVDDTGNLTPIEIRSKVRRLKAENKKIGAVIVDYLQLMEVKGNEANRVQEIAKITRALKQLAREMDVPVIALSQLSRSVEARQNKRPQLSDLRESGSIEQDADIVMFIYRDEYYNPNTEKKKTAEIIIAKHRNGAVGTIELHFNAELTKFAGLEKFAQEGG